MLALRTRCATLDEPAGRRSIPPSPMSLRDFDSSPRWRIATRFCGLALLAALSIPTASAAEAEIVELPTYTVTETRELPPPERWSYARIEGFEVLSNASDYGTRDLLQHLRQFGQALDVVWPGAQRPTETPALLIICGRGGKFDEFVPAKETDTRVDRGKISLTLQSREQSAIIVDYQTEVIDFSLRGDQVKELEVDAYQQLSREYVRFLFAGARVRFPPWFVEGVAQILMGMEVSKTLITVGRVEDPNLTKIGGTDTLAPEEWDRTFNGALKGQALLPMDELLAAATGAEAARNPIRSTWAKQAAAFVHWGIYGFGGRNQKAFFQFVTRMTREPPSEAAFQECFKLTYKQMGFELRSYVDFTAYDLREFRAKKGEKLPDLPPVQLRDATEAEVGRIKGEALRLAGHDNAARSTMVAAYIRGERDARLLAALGLEELARGDTARARKFLEAAVQNNVILPRAYLELARLRFEEISASARGAWPVADAHSVARLLLAARQQPPSNPETYELLLETWLRAAATPGLDELKVADEGVRRFPRDSSVIYRAALLMQRGGRAADAAMIARHGANVAHTAEVKAKFSQLLAALPGAQ